MHHWRPRVKSLDHGMDILVLTSQYIDNSNQEGRMRSGINMSKEPT